jgi:hypothetical protein
MAGKLKPFARQLEKRETVALLLGFEGKLEAILGDLAVLEHRLSRSVQQRPCIL